MFDAEQSRDLLTINTEKGLYRYNRLVYGVASAPTICQRTMLIIIQGLPGVKCITGNMIITGATEKEHLRNLEVVLCRLDQSNLRANLSKCEFLKERVFYLDMKLTVKAVVGAPKPTNVSELRSFLGIVNYYARFLRNLSSTFYPLHQLLAKGKEWS